MKKCENCGYEMEDGDISGYLFIEDGSYFEYHEPITEDEMGGSVHDTFICENCVINECHDIDVINCEVINAKEWLLNLIENF
jgi:hypothetical protein